MKRKIALCMIGCLVVGQLCVAQPEPNPAPSCPEVLKELRAALRGGVENLATYVRTNKPSVPQIYSQWYVEKVRKKDAEVARYEQEKRDFGREVLDKLEVLAKVLIDPNTTKDREEYTALLLDLSHWFVGIAGFGNEILVCRCEDLATVPLAHLAVDLDFPIEEADALVQRFSSLQDHYRRNAAALNLEAPEPVFDAGSGDWEAIVQRLGQSWVKGVRRSWEYLEGKGLDINEVLGEKGRALVPEDMAFFWDDDPSDRILKTTLSTWERKEHFTLVLGFVTRNIEDIRSLLTFRRMVGHFPTDPPSWWKKGNTFSKTAVQAAFETAWRPFEAKYGLGVCAGAVRAYEGVQNNTFWDEDTKQIRSWEKDQERLKKHSTKDQQ